MEEIKSSNYYWVVTKSVFACWLYLAKYKPDCHGFWEQSWTLNQERFSWSWQTIRAIVQCTLKQSWFCRSLFVCLFVAFLCVWSGGFLNVYMAWLVLNVCVKLQCKKFYCNNSNRGLQMSIALPLQITWTSPGICPQNPPNLWRRSVTVYAKNFQFAVHQLYHLVYGQTY